jgi:hypothetical protein
LIEFSLVGLPIIFVIFSVALAAIGMWQFENLEFGTQNATRFVAMHGRTCVQDGSTCVITVGDVASYFESQTFALDAAKAQVTLKSATATITCNPLNSCFGNTTVFPSTQDNGVNFDVSITSVYPVLSPITMFWPGNPSLAGSTFNLFATSRQRIIY